MTPRDKPPAENGARGKALPPALRWTGVAPLRSRWGAGEALHATLGASSRRTWQRTLCLACSVIVLFYSVMVLVHVAWMGTIGVRCLFGTEVEEEVTDDFVWRSIQPTEQAGASRAEVPDASSRIDRPNVQDRLLSIGDITLRDHSYSDYIHALRALNGQVERTVIVRWQDHLTQEIHSATATVRYPPTWSYVWSCVWFLQELLIFAVGARVFWKRPDDHSARLFLVLCLVTVGAFMGGYHWTEIVVRPSLIYPFVFFALLVPVVNLHFFLVFPRYNPILARHPRTVLSLLYGIPLVFLIALWGSMYAAHWLRLYDRAVGTTEAEQVIRVLALSYIGVATLIFSLCIPCLVYSYRQAQTLAEKNQVKWILLASLIASVLIGYFLWQAWIDTATLGRDSAAWPMVCVSLLYTIAYAFSITRYKLMQVEEIINRSVVYFAFTLTWGLIYSTLILFSGWLIGDRLMSNPTSGAAVVAALSAIVVLVLMEVIRGRFQRWTDRRFFREKYKFDQAMQKMRVAVGSLVDRITLGKALLEGAVEVLRVEWGALYLCQPSERDYHLVACHGPTPDEHALALDNPLLSRLQRTPTVCLCHAVSTGTSSDPATDAMISLGGEAASAVGANGHLAGLLILGPKRSGMPFEEEEMTFLGALGSVATLALHSADIQETLESLNRDLRGKVEKIAEQQRRILILQEQLRDRAERDRDALIPAEGTSALLDERALDDPALAVFDQIKGSSPAVRRMIAMARKVAASPSAVLIRGESGTGKELLAAAIHAASPRVSRPFVKVHCAALSQSLLESELFGHVKGAYTGADRDRVGRFEQANGGTLFLDEIGDINLEVQTKLLRVLQEMAFERVGSSQPITVDVRIVAATHQDLEALIQAGRFREDLFYRLNVIPLEAPALRNRREDIFELAVFFLNRQAERAGKALTHIEPEAVELLMAYDWPGNIRELENVIERAVILADGPALSVDDLPPEVRQPSRRRYRVRTPALVGALTAVPASIADPTPEGPGASPAAGPRQRGLAPDEGEEWNAEFLAYERQRLLDALTEAGGNKSVAARLLGMPRSTFFSKLKKHGIV
ncbi:MAG: sigma 54-interacting transcriptional regulator [Isosphaeraceae bacterium]